MVPGRLHNRYVRLALLLFMTGSAGGASAAAWHLPDNLHDGGLIVIIIALIAITPVTNFVIELLEKRREERESARAERMQILKLLSQQSEAISQQTAILERIEKRLSQEP